MFFYEVFAATSKEKTISKLAEVIFHSLFKKFFFSTQNPRKIRPLPTKARSKRAKKPLILTPFWMKIKKSTAAKEMHSPNGTPIRQLLRIS